MGRFDGVAFGVHVYKAVGKRSAGSQCGFDEVRMQHPPELEVFGGDAF